MERDPARVHILLARDTPLGVVIRRGPSNHVCTLLWDRESDKFRVGQWLKGRIYERRSDLSPDGSLLIYFAMDGRWDTEAKGSWTAISRSPYHKALAIFPKGNCWYGGGLFTGNQTYWLNDAGGHTVLRDAPELRQDPKFQPAGRFGGECPGVYYLRLLRDGWAFQTRPAEVRLARHALFEKPIGSGWTLRKIAHSTTNPPRGKGCYWDEHELVHPGSSRVVGYPGWEWADLDGSRLVWSESGRLFAGTVNDGGLTGSRELFDFNDMAFEAIPAPY